DAEFEVPGTCRAILHRVPGLMGRYGRVAAEPGVGARLARGGYDVLLAPFHGVPATWRGPAVVGVHNVLAFGEPARAVLPRYHALQRELTLRAALRRAD